MTSPWGEACAAVGDVNNDGYYDFACGSYLSPGSGGVGAVRGRVLVYSGRDGQVLRDWYGPTDSFGLGWWLEAAGDWNRDGFDDVFVVGLMNARLQAVLLSGRDGATLTSWTASGISPAAIQMRLGGDVDGDGVRDVICSDPNFDTNLGLGRLWVVSGANAAVLYDWQDSGRFGTVVADAGDVNGDGTPDVLVTAPNRYTAYGKVGEARIYSGRTGTLLASVTGGMIPNTDFGYSAAGVGDLNRDGYSDFIVGARTQQVGTASGAGRATVYSGATGQPLPSLEWFGSSVNFGLGTRVAPAGDFNDDGYPDIILGAQHHARVVSGRDGTTQWALTAPSTNLGLGFVGTAGDMNRDGSADVLLGFPATNGGTTVPYFRIYAGIPGSGGDNADRLGRVFHRVPGSQMNAGFGYSVHGGGDFDRDGYSDFLVSAHEETIGRNQRAGALTIYSGRSGLPITRLVGSQAWDYFGDSVAIVGDVDSDGYVDILAGGHGNRRGFSESGFATLISGRSFTPLHSFEGTHSWQELGTAVAALGDVDLDGQPDFLIGAYGDAISGTEAGMAMVVSGPARGYSIVRGPYRGRAGDRCGISLDGVGDLDGDARPDFVVGSPLADQGALSDCGVIRGYSGATGQLLFERFGESSGDHFGVSVSRAGDIDGDGRGDFVIGSPGHDSRGVDAGRAYVFSGANLRILHMIDGRQAGDAFGSRVSGAGDVDRDGRPDFVVGAESAQGAAGRVEIYSGSTGRVLYYLQGQGTDGLGVSVASAGDVTGDGYDDVIVGAVQGGAALGYAAILSGHPVVSLTFGTGCPGFGGLTPKIRGWGQPTIGNLAHRIDLLLARASTPALLVLGFASLGLPAGPGCTLLPTADLQLVLATTGSGTLFQPVPIPVNLDLLGLSLLAQYAVYDPSGAAFGTFSLSDGLHILIGR